MADYKELKSLKEFDIFDGTFESIKSHLFMRLFNKHNLPLGKELDSVPYFTYADMVATLSVETKDYFSGRRGVYCYMITNEDIKEFGITKEELRKIAIKNLQDKNSARIETINQHLVRANVLSPLVNKEDFGATIQLSGTQKQINHNTIFSGDQFGPVMFQKSDKKNIVLISNRTQTFASINFIMPGVLDKVCDIFEEDFYIVPSSVHEIICVKSSFITNDGEKPEKQAIEDLADMLEQINDVVQTNDKNILSYNVYCYVYGDNGVIKVS